MSLIGYSLGLLTSQHSDLLDKSDSKSLSQRQQTQSSRPGVLLGGPVFTMLAGAELANGEGNPGIEGP